MLLDTVDPSKTGTLLQALEGVSKLDYVVVHHVEQDHSGSLPVILARHPEAKVLCSPKAVELLQSHLHVSPETAAGGGGQRDPPARRQDAPLSSHSVGALAGDHVQLSWRKTGSCSVATSSVRISPPPTCSQTRTRSSRRPSGTTRRS